MDLAVEVGVVMEVDEVEEVEEEEARTEEVALEEAGALVVEMVVKSMEIVYANQAGTNSH
jgi:hypothetical protein